MKFRTNLKIKSSLIEPAPFVDIFLQIIIFFVLCTQFLGRPGLVLELPKATLPALFQDTTARVLLRPEGIYFKGDSLTVVELKNKLDKNLVSVLVIEAGKDIAHARVVEVMELAKRAGIPQIAIAVDEEKLAGQ